MVPWCHYLRSVCGEKFLVYFLKYTLGFHLSTLLNLLSETFGSDYASCENTSMNICFVPQ
jgi:hypothetical protein